ncbi:MAG: TonB-dependent siderophore receptor [Vicinamibacterales bacterium]
MARPLKIFRRYPKTSPPVSRPPGPSLPRRRASRLAAGALAASTAFALAPAATAAPRASAPIPVQAAAHAPRDFDIAEGPLPEVLAAFEAATGLKIVVALDRVEGIQSPGVRGTLTPEQALTELLSGTALTFRLAGNGVVTIDIQVSEFVAVEGSLPRPSSPKFTEPLREIPQTVTVIPQAVIEAQGATTLRDVLRNVPGITYQAGEGGGGLPGDKMTMRGFRAENDIFVDGIRDVGAFTRDAFNLEQVEVVKGPSSTFGGRGATGGAINLATKAPGLSRSQSASFGVGSASYQRGTLDVNQPIAAIDGAAFRVNAMWTDTGVAGRDVVENQSWAVAPSLAFGINHPTHVTLSSQHLRADNVPDYGLPWAANGATPAVDQSNFYGLRDYDYEDIANDVGTLRIDHQRSERVRLLNQTRVARTVRDHAITAPRPPNRQLQQRHLENGLFANQTAMNVVGGRHTVSAGVDLIRETSETYNSAQTTNQPQVDLYAPNPDDLPFGPRPENTGNPGESTTTTVGAYLFDTFHVHEQWSLTGGLRWDRSAVDYESTVRATGDTTALSREDAFVTWRGGVVYEPARHGSIYLGVGTSVDPSADAGNVGTALSDSPTSANNINLDPEKTFNVEVGSKWDLAGGRISLTGAVFRTEKTNARTRNANNEPFVLDGRQRVDGVELGASGRITPAWSVFANASFLDSRIEASANAAEQDQNLALTPRKSASLWTTVDLPHGVTFGGGAEFRDSVFRNATNTTEVPSYWLLNATASYRVGPKLTLRMNADNLADEQYVDRVGGGHYIPGARRTVRLTADVRF